MKLPGTIAIVALIATGTTLVFAPSQGSTWRVSVSSSGGQGNRGSGQLLGPVISASGRFVAFESEASTLVPGDTNGVADLFVRDRQTGQTTRVSQSSSGEQASGSSYLPSISADGRYVAFGSLASNLVAGDTNGVPDVFVHDRQTGQTSRVSVSSSGQQGNGSSPYPSISSEGRYIAFYSRASNFVQGDSSAQDIFVHDRQTGQTTRVSVRSSGEPANGPSFYPSISADGRYISFYSDATNLADADTNSSGDVFLHDRQTGQTERVSVGSDGTQGNRDSWFSSVSADGRHVAFLSYSSNFAQGDTNNAWDAFVHDRQTGQTECVSVSMSGLPGNFACLEWCLSMGPDARYVTFSSHARDLVQGDTNNRPDVFVRDRETGQTTRVSLISGGAQGDGDSDSSMISADGRFVAFSSAATNLVPGDSNSAYDVFVHQYRSKPSLKRSPPSD